MVVSMHKLMSERMIHLLLTHQMIVAQYDPIGRSEPATCLCRAILNPEKALVHLTASLLQLLHHELDSGVPVERILQHLVTVCVGDADPLRMWLLRRLLRFSDHSV